MTLEDIRQRLWGDFGESKCRGLLLLGGASPLPNLLAVLALRPPRVAVLYSESTHSQADRFQQVVSGYYNPHFDSLPVLSNPYDPNRIATELGSRQIGNYALCYTGGTKPMAVHVHRMWLEQAKAPQYSTLPDASERACYLSDADLELKFDATGFHTDISTVNVPIKELVALHGLPPFKHVRPVDGSTSVETGIALEVLGQVLVDVDVAARLFQKSKAKPLNNRNVVAGECGVSSLADFPRNNESFAQFIGGDWLEYAVGRFLHKAGMHDETLGNLRTPVPGAQEFQLDLCHRRGGRIFAVSCTTGRGEWSSSMKKNIKESTLTAEEQAELTQRGHVKLKVFEVQERARQIGGELARSAVVCLAGPSDCTGLQAEVVRAWPGDQHKPDVFGIADLREWHLGIVTSLQEWFKGSRS